MSRRSTLSTKPLPRPAASEGWWARRCGVSRYANPYRRGDRRWHEWLAGWRGGG